MDATVTAGPDKRWIAAPIPVHKWIWSVKTDLSAVRGRNVTMSEALEHIQQVYELATEGE